MSSSCRDASKAAVLQAMLLELGLQHTADALLVEVRRKEEQNAAERAQADSASQLSAAPQTEELLYHIHRCVLENFVLGGSILDTSATVASADMTAEAKAVATALLTLHPAQAGAKGPMLALPSFASAVELLVEHALLVAMPAECCDTWRYLAAHRGHVLASGLLSAIDAARYLEQLTLVVEGGDESVGGLRAPNGDPSAAASDVQTTPTPAPAAARRSQSRASRSRARAIAKLLHQPYTSPPTTDDDEGGGSTAAPTAAAAAASTGKLSAAEDERRSLLRLRRLWLVADVAAASAQRHSTVEHSPSCSKSGLQLRARLSSLLLAVVAAEVRPLAKAALQQQLQVLTGTGDATAGDAALVFSPPEGRAALPWIRALQDALLGLAWPALVAAPPAETQRDPAFTSTVQASRPSLCLVQQPPVCIFNFGLRADITRRLSGRSEEDQEEGNASDLPCDESAAEAHREELSPGSAASGRARAAAAVAATPSPHSDSPDEAALHGSASLDSYLASDDEHVDEERASTIPSSDSEGSDASPTASGSSPRGAASSDGVGAVQHGPPPAHHAIPEEPLDVAVSPCGTLWALVTSKLRVIVMASSASAREAGETTGSRSGAHAPLRVVHVASAAAASDGGASASLRVDATIRFALTDPSAVVAFFGVSACAGRCPPPLAFDALVVNGVSATAAAAAPTSRHVSVACHFLHPVGSSGIHAACTLSPSLARHSSPRGEEVLTVGDDDVLRSAFPAASDGGGVGGFVVLQRIRLACCVDVAHSLLTDSIYVIDARVGALSVLDALCYADVDDTTRTVVRSGCVPRVTRCAFPPRTGPHASASADDGFFFRGALQPVWDRRDAEEEEDGAGDASDNDGASVTGSPPPRTRADDGGALLHRLSQRMVPLAYRRRQKRERYIDDSSDYGHGDATSRSGRVGQQPQVHRVPSGARVVYTFPSPDADRDAPPRGLAALAALGREYRQVVGRTLLSFATQRHLPHRLLVLLAADDTSRVSPVSQPAQLLPGCYVALVFDTVLGQTVREIAVCPLMPPARFTCRPCVWRTAKDVPHRERIMFLRAACVEIETCDITARRQQPAASTSPSFAVAIGGPGQTLHVFDVSSGRRLQTIDTGTHASATSPPPSAAVPPHAHVERDEARAVAWAEAVYADGASLPGAAEAYGPARSALHRLLWTMPETPPSSGGGTAGLQKELSPAAVGSSGRRQPFFGHDHKGGYLRQDNTHCVTMQGQIETLANSFAVVEVYVDRVELSGGRRQPPALHVPPADITPQLITSRSCFGAVSGVAAASDGSGSVRIVSCDELGLCFAAGFSQ